MIFLRNYDNNQQKKQTVRVSTYTKKQSTIKLLLITFVFLIVTVMGTVNAQTEGANLKLELTTTSNRLIDDEGAMQQINLAIGSQVGLRVSSDTDSYIYIYNFNSLGDFILLTDSDYNFLPAGQERSYPSNNSLYGVAGPVGRQSVFAIASHQPLSSVRLEELKTQQLRIMLGGASQTEVQDGWLADSIIFNVVDNSNSQTGQAPLVNSVVSNVTVTNVVDSW